MDLSHAWKHLAAFLFAAILFGLATTFLVLFRASVASNLALLLVIVTGYLGALAVAFPAESRKARAQLTLWRAAWKKTTADDHAP